MYIWTGGLLMICRFRLLKFVAVACLAAGVGILPQSAGALDTPNLLMGIDGMTINHAGLFRNGTPNEGFNTFVFFSFSMFPGEEGRYKSFFVVDNNVNPDDPQNFGGVSHNARYHSDTPEAFNGLDAYTAPAGFDLDTDFYPAIDRGSFGQVFDPAEYQIEVKFKPNIAGGGALPILNEAHTFNVGLDQVDGYVWDAEAGIYKRANDAFTYTIGTEELGINDWYAAAAKDADGFATYTAPVSTPSFVQRGFYYLFGDNPFRAANVVTGGGRMQNEDLTWSDVNDGLDPLSFGGGAVDPSRPNSQLKVPNGVPLISLGSAGDGSPDETRVLSLEVRSVALKRISPSPIMARVDANSGLTFRFGTGLSYSTVAEGQAASAPPIDVAGTPFLPNYTDQITRFDQNGMTNLFINPRSGPDPNEGYRFFIRNAPGAESFDGTTAQVNVRARLTEPLSNPGIAQSMTIYARDLDGSDTNAPTVVGPITIPEDPVGADEYSFILDLSQFNTSTFTTVSIDLSDFTLNNLPFGFVNPGDGLLTDFNVFEFGALVPNGGGLVRLELEYMQISVPTEGTPGDFDGDGDVDGADFLVWQRGGSPNPLSAADLADWRANFGPGGSLSATAGVPEPGALVLAAMALVFVVRRRS
jgi:hypothetical protein